MSVAPETLDTALCEWCTYGTPATSKVEVQCREYPPMIASLCSECCQEVASEFTAVTLHPLTWTKPDYTLLETYANPMTNEYTIKELETAARYGAPYPVCGDLTTRKRVGKSWTGHDPEGNQY